MRILLDIKKNIEQNASVYFEKAKKAKGKIEGIKKTIARYKTQLEKVKQEKVKIEETQKEEKIKRKPEWFEKFRWFISSEGFLVIGGRDATSNELVIKKHTEKNDLVFHTDMAGSPFFVVKIKDKKPTEKTIKEVADATVTYAKAWKLGMQTTPVFWVKPDQVSKEANPGEYLTKGAFMIRGKTNYVDNNTNISVGITKKGAVMGGPLEAVKKNCEKFVILEQGKEKTAAVAKKIKAKIGGDLDEIIRAIPAGGCKIK
ncbi:NFACT RNA binding domain-containing protein [Nanoarchaeota archaeon]